MHRVADRRGEHLGLDLLLAVGGHDIGDHPHPVLVDVVEPAGERAHDVRARRGRQERLIDREAERHVDPYALACEDLAGREAVGREGNLDDHVLVPACDAPAFDDHVVLLLRHDLRGDVADDLADPLDLLLVVVAGLRDQRRVRGHPVDDAPAHALRDLFVDGRVEEELHGVGNSCRRDAASAARPFDRANDIAASMNEMNSGCGRFGRDLNSG